jgi:hypothetical protein
MMEYTKTSFGICRVAAILLALQLIVPIIETTRLNSDSIADIQM